MPRVENVRPSVTILFFAANPSDSTRLALGEESRAIGNKLQTAGLRQHFRLESAWAVRASDLQREFLQHHPTIVHFSGHGDEAGELLLHDDFGGSRTVSNDALANLFRIFKKYVRCVVLNACYSEAQAKAIARHIDCVIGMSGSIPDQTAIAFSSGFYEALGFGKDVETAFELARNLIDLEGLSAADLPQLICREDVIASEVVLTNP